jgi:hypothetical protein
MQNNDLLTQNLSNNEKTFLSYVKNTLYTIDISGLLHNLLKKTVEKDVELNTIHNHQKVITYKTNFNNLVRTLREKKQNLEYVQNLSTENNSQLGIIRDFNNDLNDIISDINKLNDSIANVENQIMTNKEQDKPKQLKEVIKTINSNIYTVRGKQQYLQQKINWSDYNNEYKLNELKIANKMSLRNDDSYKAVSYNIIKNSRENENMSLLQELNDALLKLIDQTEEVYQKIITTDNLESKQGFLQILKNLDSNLKDLDNNEKIESFENINKYYIQYLTPDYKKILLSKEKCEQLESINENILCSEDNYKNNTEECLKRILCIQQANSSKLNNNQLLESKAEEDYDNNKKIYNTVVVDTINLTLGIFCIGIFILKNRNIV